MGFVGDTSTPPDPAERLVGSEAGAAAVDVSVRCVAPGSSCSTAGGLSGQLEKSSCFLGRLDACYENDRSTDAPCRTISRRSCPRRGRRDDVVVVVVAAAGENGKKRERKLHRTTPLEPVQSSARFPNFPPSFLPIYDTHHQAMMGWGGGRHTKRRRLLFSRRKLAFGLSFSFAEYSAGRSP